MPVRNPTSLYQLELLCPSLLSPLTNSNGFIRHPFTKAIFPNNKIPLTHVSTNSILHYKQLVQRVCRYPGLQLPPPSKLHTMFSSPHFPLRKLSERRGPSREQLSCRTAFCSAADAQRGSASSTTLLSSLCPWRVRKIPPPQPQIHRNLSRGLV